ncbi:uncharacterized protein Fot_29578 [Forsythia ovata]|uniref:Uncharacterized protein n=1 Tax=Forsythia ovata TaxID=205694 RepID=A0ABD1TS99_9LAMI
MVASSPSRVCDSRSRLVVSPTFATTQGSLSTSSLDKRDYRSARRSSIYCIRSPKKVHQHDQNPLSQSQPSLSPDSTPPSPTSPLGAPTLPLRRSTHCNSRFQTDPSAPLSQPIPTPTNLPAISKRTFKNTATTANNAPATILDTQFLSPPKHLIESTHQRTLSSNTCSVTEAEVLSPPRKLVESAHRRSISSSTCSIESNLQKSNVDNWQLKEKVLKAQELNVFLKEQRIKIGKILSGEIRRKAKIVLSGPSNS